jgi:hypothetical protein
LLDNLLSPLLKDWLIALRGKYVSTLSSVASGMLFVFRTYPLRTLQRPSPNPEAAKRRFLLFLSSFDSCTATRWRKEGCFKLQQ